VIDQPFDIFYGLAVFVAVVIVSIIVSIPARTSLSGHALAGVSVCTGAAVTALAIYSLFKKAQDFMGSALLATLASAVVVYLLWAWGLRSEGRR
jgi:uncharacterized membrane protein